MAARGTEWTVHPHDEIEKLAENLWHVTGSLPNMSLRRVMTIARQRDGRLVVHSPICLSEDAMKEIDGFGKVGFIVVPNGMHRLDAPAWKARYPDAKVVAPKGAKKKIEQKLPVDLTYDEFEGDDSIGLQTLDGVRDAEGVMTVRSSDGTSAVLNDAVFNMEVPKDFMGRLVTWLFGSAPGPRVSRLAKLLLVSDNEALRHHLVRIASTPDLVRVIVSHDKIARGAEARAALESAITFL